MTLACASVVFGYRRGAPILRDVSCSLTPGEVTAIVGPNGAGKSTLLRVLLGLRAPWSGRATLDGRDVGRMPGRERAARIAYVPQQASVAGAFTARQVAAIGRFALARDDGAVERALRVMESLDRADEPYGTLSVGQQQRVAVARALAQLDHDARPGAGPPARYLLADEPIAAMDPRHAGATLAALRALAKDGVGVGVVLHDLTAARRCADRAVVLGESGALAADGPVDRALAPDILEGVFRTRIELVETASGAALLPRFDKPAAP